MILISTYLHILFKRLCFLLFHLFAYKNCLIFLDKNNNNNRERQDMSILLSPHEKNLDCQFLVVNKMKRRLEKYWIDRLDNRDLFLDIID